MKSHIRFTAITVLLILTAGGCSTTSIPTYVRDEHPYKQKFYAGFGKVRDTAEEALVDLGWEISHETDPSVFERTPNLDESQAEQIALFTEIKQFPLFLGTRYGRVNVFIRETADNAVEVEVRYVTVTSVLFKNFYQYRNEGGAKRILKHIEERLG